MVTRAQGESGAKHRRRAAGAALVLATGLTLADCSSSNSNSRAGQTPPDA
jgi:hypothetical protein